MSMMLPSHDDVRSTPASDNARRMPDLSIVIVAQHERTPIEPCLASVRTQTDVDTQVVEYLVVDGTPAGAFRFRDNKARFLDAIYVPAPQAKSLPILHGIGIAAARGRLIAITEAHCTFAPDWAATAIGAHEAQPAAAIGGAVEPGDSLRLIDWALYWCDYGHFLLPQTLRTTANLSGNNIVFDRSALDRTSDFARGGFWKTFHCHQLEAAGRRLQLDPRLVVRYHRHLNLPQLVIRRYHHGRCFGAMRAARISSGRRVLYALIGPFMPGLLLLRLLRDIWPKQRYRRQIVLSLPIAFVAILVWSISEWIGNLFGAGKSCDAL